MVETRSKTFKSGNSVAVRLPKEVALDPGVEVVIERSGDVLTVYPAPAPIADMLRRLEAMPRPSKVQTRDEIDWPARNQR